VLQDLSPSTVLAGDCPPVGLEHEKASATFLVNEEDGRSQPDVVGLYRMFGQADVGESGVVFGGRLNCQQIPLRRLVLFAEPLRNGDQRDTGPDRIRVIRS
jgi:hypothetical protein